MDKMMSKRYAFILTILALCGTLLHAAPKPPNIVFLLTDDQRFDAVGFMGNEEIKTPNLDELAARGTVFDNHFNTTSICMPSRANLMTGCYEYIHGVSFGRGPMEKKYWSQTYPVLLRANGYFTGFGGKFGFDLSAPRRAPKHERLPTEDFDIWAGWPGQGTYNTAKNEYTAKYAKDYPHVTRALGAFGQDFIKAAAKQDKPFCLSISFKAPHSPESYDPFFKDLYEGVTFSKPDNYGTAVDHLAPQSRLGRQAQLIGPGYLTDEGYQKKLHIYYRQISGVDYAVGMIREALAEQGVADNTVILFTTDNGYFCGSHKLGGKALLYEDATRAPMVVYDPHNEASHGKRVAGISAGIDIAPTILTFAGVEVPPIMNGIPLQPMLDNPETRIRKQLSLHQIWNQTRDDVIGSMGVVTEDYRYTYWYYADDGMPPTEELFSRKRDRWEQTNLIHNPEQAPMLAHMRSLYDANLAEWKAGRTESNSYPRYDTIADRQIPWQEKKFIVNEFDYSQPRHAKKTKKRKKE